MKRKLRLRQILELLDVEPELSVEEACARLDSSPATIRRDFAQMAAEGRVEKMWGGIRKLAQASVALAPPAFAQRLDAETTEKRGIARAAAELLQDGETVMIDGGTTTYQLAEFLAPKRIRILTNSIAVAHAIDQLRGNRRGAEVYLCGGLLQPESGVVAGPPAEAFLKRYRADWAFLSAAGIDETSVTNYNEAVLASERLMVERSSQVVLLADHTKLGRQAMCAICPVSKLDHLFTSAGNGKRALLAKIAAAKVKVRQIEAAS